MFGLSKVNFKELSEFIYKISWPVSMGAGFLFFIGKYNPDFVTFGFYEDFLGILFSVFIVSAAFCFYNVLGYLDKMLTKIFCYIKRKFNVYKSKRKVLYYLPHLTDMEHHVLSISVVNRNRKILIPDSILVIRNLQAVTGSLRDKGIIEFKSDGFGSIYHEIVDFVWEEIKNDPEYLKND